MAVWAEHVAGRQTPLSAVLLSTPAATVVRLQSNAVSLHLYSMAAAGAKVLRAYICAHEHLY